MMTDPVHFDVAIVGAGHGGAQAAIQLRQLGFQGSIGLIGAELELPYERPPLSKDYLAGEKDFERMAIRPAAFWAERHIDLVPGVRIDRIDPHARLISASAGRQFGYGKLIWATGGIARRLNGPGCDLDGIHVVRCRADVDRIRAELDEVRREAAAVLRSLGKEVVVVEALDRVLARVAAPAISHFYQDEHRMRGVDVRLGASVDRIEGANGRMTGIALSDGETIEAELAIVGIGIAPAIEPLLAAGAAGANGIDVDTACRTSLADIYAVGDCAAQVSPFAAGRRVRIESVQNAHDQAAAAAGSILGLPTGEPPVPWFWSNQYDLKLQTVGLSVGHDRTILRGRPEDRSFSLVYLRNGRVIALDCVNSVRDYAQGRRLVAGGVQADSDMLADQSIPLKELVV